MGKQSQYRVIIIIGALLFLSALLFPPWLVTKKVAYYGREKVISKNIEFDFLLTERRVNIYDTNFEREISTSTLVIEFLSISIILALIFFLIKYSSSEEKRSKFSVYVSRKKLGYFLGVVTFIGAITFYVSSLLSEGGDKIARGSQAYDTVITPAPAPMPEPAPAPISSTNSYEQDSEFYAKMNRILLESYSEFVLMNKVRSCNVCIFSSRGYYPEYLVCAVGDSSSELNTKENISTLQVEIPSNIDLSIREKKESRPQEIFEPEDRYRRGLALQIRAGYSAWQNALSERDEQYYQLKILLRTSEKQEALAELERQCQ
jgi:hypothetical protein